MIAYNHNSPNSPNSPNSLTHPTLFIGETLPEQLAQLHRACDQDAISLVYQLGHLL
jgi:hypothetical protein